MNIRRILAVGAVSVVAFALVACTGDSGSNGTETPTQPPTATSPADNGGGGNLGGDTPVVPGPGGGNGQVGNDTPPPVGADRRLEEAPVEDLEILIRESFPPQYAVIVRSGLPSGCAAYEGTQVERDGEVITLTVWNSMPADPNVMCTMIYGIAENTINLGSDFESGVTYTVHAGEQTITFVAQ